MSQRQIENCLEFQGHKGIKTEHIICIMDDFISYLDKKSKEIKKTEPVKKQTKPTDVT